MAGRFLRITSLLAAFMWLGCAHTSWIPRCEAWPDSAIEEFIELQRERGQSSLIRAVLRDARFCSALARM